MKTDIHPTYHTDTKVTCACGAKYTVGSTAQEIKTDVCSACHPFYTGKQDHLIDTTGRVDKFKAKMEKAKAHRKKMGIEEEPKAEETTEAPVEETAAEETAEAPEAVEEVAEAANEEPTTEEASEEAPAEEAEEKTEEAA